MRPAAQRAGCQGGGLRTLCAELLGKQLSKKQQKSDWARPDLTKAQVKYAAADAWVSRQIALKLAPHLRYQVKAVKK